MIVKPLHHTCPRCSTGHTISEIPDPSDSKVCNICTICGLMMRVELDGNTLTLCRPSATDCVEMMGDDPDIALQSLKYHAEWVLLKKGNAYWNWGDEESFLEKTKLPKGHKRNCPHCGRTAMEHSVSINCEISGHLAKPGDYQICGECMEVSVFDENMEAIKPTKEQMVEFNIADDGQIAYKLAELTFNKSMQEAREKQEKDGDLDIG